MRRAVLAIVGWIVRAVVGEKGPTTDVSHVGLAGTPSAAVSDPTTAPSEPPPDGKPAVALTIAAEDGKPKPVASRHHPSGILPVYARLTYERRCVLVETLRWRADSESGLSEADRAEFRRQAQNFECFGRVMDRKHARFNRHPDHPTVQ